MKTPFLLLSLFFICSVFSQNGAVEDQLKYKAVYELTYQPDSTDLESITSETMWLYMGEELSLFSSEGKALKDSLSANITMSDINRSDFQARARSAKTDFDYTLYKGFPEGKISYTLQIVQDKLRYEEDKDFFNWEILPETKTIKGYKGQKATTTFAGREYVAWFTSEIPISEGPYKFHGLPGLILEISDTRDHYHFLLTEFKNLQEPLVVKLNPGEFSLTSKEKLLQLKMEYEKDPFSAIESRNTGGRTVSINFDKGDKKKLLKQRRKELEKKNNPLELEK